MFPAVGVARYEIVVRGRLGRALEVMFEDMNVTASNGETSDETLLSGYFQDQAALQGFLAEMGDLGLELNGVRRLADSDTSSGDGQPA